MEGTADELAALHRAVAFLTSDGSNQWPFSFWPTDKVDSSDMDECFKFGKLLGELDFNAPTTAKPIQADRITFGGSPSFDPRELLDKQTLAMYDDPLSQALPVDESPSPPVVKVLASAEEKLKLFRKLAETGRLQIFRADEVFPAYAAGVFSVVKDLHRDRLILDARPCNIRSL